MKKILIFILCLILCIAAAIAAVSCNNNRNGENPNAPIGGISTAEADEEALKETEEEQDENSDRTEETDRKEIENNLRDARELIKDGYIEDATMIIDGLKTRDLTDAERQELLELQKQMIKISD